MEPDGAANSPEHGGYGYRAIATIWDELSDSEIIFAGDRLAGGKCRPNELYFGLCTLSFNVFALLCHLLPVEWAQSRASTVRLRLPALAGKIVHHGHQWTIKLQADRHVVLSAALSH